jgi:mono/diheme cytochrome c family protein
LTDVRILLARLLVVLTGVLIVLLAVAFAAIRNTPGAAVAGSAVTAASPVDSPAASGARGRAVYEAQRCASCHSIAGHGNTRSPLDGVGRRLSAGEIRSWITQPPAGIPHRYRLPDVDVDALVAYLAAQRP